MVVAIKTVTVAAIVLAAANAAQTVPAAARRLNKRVIVILEYKPYSQNLFDHTAFCFKQASMSSFYLLFQQFSSIFVTRVSTYNYARID